MQALRDFFVPLETFTEEEWILKYQISAMLILSFCFGLGVLPFAYVRFSEGNTTVGFSQLLFGSFLLYGFWHLRRDKRFYRFYSILFFILFFVYTAIVFFYVPQNHLNILWVISAPILIFFFLNRRGGMVMFVLVMLFIGYLIVTAHPYTTAEYITLVGAFLTTTFIMYVYEAVKSSEKQRIMQYNRHLKEEIDKHTARLQLLNAKLEQRVEEEVQKRIEQEQMLLRQCRMASIGEMMASIAHQWRQPLMNINAVLLNIDRVVSQKEPDRVYLTKKVDEIATLTTHMSRTIEDFKNLFKPKQERSAFLLHVLVEDVLLLLKNNRTL